MDEKKCRIYHGKKYYLKDGYYVRSERLHRQVWEDNFGTIPDNFVIHHKNGDMTDNRLENLECLHKSKHHSLHFNSEKQVKHLHSQRWKATLWHKSKEGRKWHSENSKRTWKKRKPKERTCVICGKDFLTMNFAGTKYCSQRCRSKAGYDKNKVKIFCIMCNNQFETQKIKNFARTCSPKCGAMLAAKTKREKKCESISPT